MRKKSNSFYPTTEIEQKYWDQGLSCVGIDEVGRGCLAGPVVVAAVILPQSLLERERDVIATKSLERERVERATREHGDASVSNTLLGAGEKVSGSNLYATKSNEQFWNEVKDSKQLTPIQREKLAAKIQTHAKTQVAWCTSEEIDSHNILKASMIAMRRALTSFQKDAQVLLVDGHLSPLDPRFDLDVPLHPRFTLDVPLHPRFTLEKEPQVFFPYVLPIVKGDSRVLSIAAASIVAKVYRDQWMKELDQTFPVYGFKSHKGYPTTAHRKALQEHGPSPIHRMSFTLL